jgi:Flp pilus assembly protein TadD
MHATLGNVMLRRTDAEAALREFETATNLRPRDVDAWLGAGLALQSLGRAPEARARLERALAIARERAPARVREIEALLARRPGPP